MSDVISKKFDDALERAKSALQKAVEQDRLSNNQEAVRLYAEGIDGLLEAMNVLDSNDARRKAIRDKINGYMGRAETLRGRSRFSVSYVDRRQIRADSTGHGYERIFGQCCDDALTSVDVQDAYIRAHHQVLNFVRFCEMLVSRAKNLRQIRLTTTRESNGFDAESALTQLTSSLKTFNIVLDVQYSTTIHDREIRFDNGWLIKAGRGLDYFKNPGKFSIGSCDINLRPCYETTIDIFRIT